MAYFDMTAANAALKELYADQVVQNLVYKNNPALALIKKFTEFGGKYLPVPIITGASQGRSSVFANAQANQSAAQIESFLLTSKSDYSIATIDNKTLLASKTDKMSFVQGAKTVIDAAIRAIKLSAASSEYRSGTGSIGQLAASGGISSGVITLLNPADVVQFEINQVLQAAATDGGTPRPALGYVIAVDRTAGTVTVSATAMGGSAGSPASWSNSDYLLQQGDSNAKMSGFAAWVPGTAPGSSDNFYGVNRSVDPVRLAGVRYTGSSQSVEEALIDASLLTAREDASVDTGFMPFASYGGLEKALGSKVQYADLSMGEIMFRGIRVNGANGEIKIIPDRNCQVATCFLLQFDTWTLNSLNEVPFILRYQDGMDMLRVYNADAAELRVGYYANLSCNAPGWNANVTLGV